MTTKRNESGHHDTDHRFTSHIPRTHNRTCTSPSLTLVSHARIPHSAITIFRDLTVTGQHPFAEARVLTVQVPTVQVPNENGWLP
jgi:hypothetical protein